MNGIGSWFSRKRATASRTAVSQPKADKRRPRRSGIMALEPRIMYDGAAAATASHSHHHDHGPADNGQAPGADNHPPPPANTGNSVEDKHGRNDSAAQPMPQVLTAVKAPSEILFIDSQVPDYQSLASGAKPGVEVVLLNPDSDGLQQIADFLSRHPDPNLTTIDIVAHGTSGEMMLGSTDITDANLSTHAAALAQIGAALGPDGAIELYSCNVASGTPGLQFISDLSKDAGGADVVASTHNLGDTPSGENWTLDAATGALKTASPFTAAAMASFQGLLGGETKVNQANDTATSPGESAVAALPNGDYVVAWVGTDPTTFDGEVLARVFDANGNAITINGTSNDLVLTDPSTISVASVSLAALPAVAGNTPNGGFVIAYDVQNLVTGGDDLLSEVYAFNAAGTTITKVAATQVSTDPNDTLDEQQVSTIAVNANGSYVVAWEQVVGIVGNIEAQFYNSSDAAVGANIRVNATLATTNGTSDETPSATALANGDFAIAWNNIGNNDVLAKVFTPTGVVVTSDFVASTNAAAPGDGTSIAGLATSSGPDSGGYVVTWTTTGGQVFARMFSAAGVGGAAIQVETATTSEWSNVTATQDGGFLVEWNAGAAHVDAQRFDASGNALSSEFQVDNGVSAPSGTVAEISTGGGAHDSAAVLQNGQVVVAFNTTQISNGAQNVWVDQFTMNNAPTGTNNTVTILENHSYTFATSDFGFSDSNSPPEAFTAVEITTLPSSGTLTDNGAAVTAGEFISVADIAGGKLVFTPVSGSSGSPDSHFTFQVEDNGSTSNGGVNTDLTPRTFTFDVTHVNQPPTTSNSSVTVDENATYTFKASDFPFSDTANNPSPTTLQDVIITSLPATGTLTDNGAAVTAGEVISVTDITGGKLVFTPAAGTFGNNNASFNFEVEDGGSTANGGVNTSTAATMTVNVTEVDQAPTVSAPASIQASANTAAPITGVSFADVDGDGGAETATFSATIGTFTASSGAGVTVSGSGGHTITLTGTTAALTSFISASDLSFTTAASDTIQVTINDNGHTGIDGPLTATTSINVGVGPQVTGGITVNDTEGASTGTITLATFTDTAITTPTTGDFTASINWGDGTASTTGTISGPASGGVFTVSSGGTPMRKRVRTPSP
jgi:hypothetical protein